MRTTALLLVAAVLLAACTGDDRPFEEAVEASEGNIDRLEVNPLAGVVTPVTIGVGDRMRVVASAFNAAGGESDFDSEDRSWSVSDTSVATINRDGLLIGRADGTVAVNLEFGGLRATPLEVRVSSAALAGIASIEGPAELEACLGQEYTTIGSFEDGNDRNLTDVAYSRVPMASTELIAEPDDLRGRILLISQEPGTVTLTASSGGFSLARDLSVLDNLTALSFPAGLRVVDEDDTIQLSASGTYTRDGNDVLVDVTQSVSWSVTDGTGSATITNEPFDRGALTGVDSGTVNVEVVCGGFRTSQLVQITSDDDDDDNDDDGLSFESGTTLTVSLNGGSRQLAVSTGSTYDEDDDVTDDVVFQTLNSNIVTIGGDGLLFPVSTGTTDIQAIRDGEIATLTVTVI